MFLLYRKKMKKTEKLPNIEQLVEFNRYLKRRLHTVTSSRGKKCFLVDGGEKEIKARPFGIPNLVSARQESYNPALPWTFERPYWFSTVKPYIWQEHLTRREAWLALGKDCEFVSTCEDINAMCEASTGGPGLANAYVLGWRVHGIHQEHGYTVIPVQYYQIDIERHKELGIEFNKDYLKFLTGLVEEERIRDIIKTNP